MVVDGHRLLKRVFYGFFVFLRRNGMLFEKFLKQFKAMSEEDFKKELREAKEDAERELILLLYNFYHRHCPKNVYHYTDFSALEGILCGAGIRLCRSDKMNDKGELYNFVDLLKKSVSKRFADDENMLKEIDKRFCDVQQERKTDICYLASFSTWEDDVSQWERYGNDGFGISISFDVETLKKISLEKEIAFQEVFYGKNADFHQLTDVFEDLFKQKELVRHTFYPNDWKAAFDSTWAVAGAHKQHSFASEQEFRLLTLPLWNGKRHDNLGETHIVTTPSGFRECLYLDWKKTCEELKIPYENLITKITIGPRSPLTTIELKEWLNAKGLKCFCDCVTKSESTLR